MDILPDSVASVNVTVVFPASVDVVDDSLAVYQRMNTSDVSIKLNQKNLTQSDSTFIIDIPVLIKSENISTLISMTYIEYSFTQFIVFREFADVLPFPEVYLFQLSLDLYLNSSSDPRTDGMLITHREMNVWRIEMTNVIGPTGNLVFTIDSEYDQMHITDVDIIVVG